MASQYFFCCKILFVAEAGYSDMTFLLLRFCCQGLFWCAENKLHQSGEGSGVEAYEYWRVVASESSPSMKNDVGEIICNVSLDMILMIELLHHFIN
jgi:hypothetical protein